MVANHFVPNPAGIAEALYGPTGPVYRHILAFGERVSGYAKAHAPLDTGALRKNIHASLPERTPAGLELQVGSDVRKPGQAWSYALVVHQGHRALPVVKTGAIMKFPHDSRRVPKNPGGGRFVYTRKVKAVAGRRYLTLGVEAVNAQLPAEDRFILILAPRNVS